MNQARWALGVLGVLLVGGVLVAVLWPTTQARSKATRSSQSAGSADSTAARRKPTEESEDGLPAGRLPASPAVDPGEAPTPTDDAVDAEAPSAEEIAVRVDQRFEREPYGGAAARDFTTKLELTFQVPGAALESVECRAVLCKAIVVMDNEEADRRVLPAVLKDSDSGLNRLAAIAAAREVTGGGRVRVTLYVAQSGGIPVD